ncbi:MAG: prepilin-type N-terminal cleavage/methylation domain-containing protein [Thermodesulfobacteriota bacterium]
MVNRNGGQDTAVTSMDRPVGNRGFTLIEVMIAVFLLAVALSGLAALTATVVKGNEVSQTLTTATTLARDKMEDLKRIPYESLATGSDTRSMDNLNYTRVWNVSGENNNRKTVDVTVTWTWLNFSRSVTLRTMRAKNN